MITKATLAVLAIILLGMFPEAAFTGVYVFLTLSILVCIVGAGMISIALLLSLVAAWTDRKHSQIEND